MHTGKSYKTIHFLNWTRRSIFWLLLWGAIPTVLYQVLDWKWLTIPWPVAALLGTATAFIVGFKNLQTYNRTWENADKPYNREYKQFYIVPEKKTPLDEELLIYIPRQEMENILPKNNSATQLLGLQSDALRKLYNDGLIDNFRFLSMHDKLTQFSDHQGRSERIKNFPYPRQYATISTLLVKLFCLTLPFAMLGEVDLPPALQPQNEIIM